jgi:hypothetical protein
MNCRFCDSELKHVFADLGKTPLANSYLKKEELEKKENYYPLRVFVCSKCFLVQLEEFESPKEIFSEYAYFSSFSEKWLEHAQKFVESVTSRFNLDHQSKVLEIASNDGYMLQFFKDRKIPVLGVEPAVNISKIANEREIPTITKFFGSDVAEEIAEEKRKQTLVIAFNVLPHTPNPSDFILGLKKITEKNGVIVIQFSAYLPTLISNREFDTVYHEHFSYFSLLTLKKIFSKFELEIFDVEELNIHGGSLRLYIKHSENAYFKIENSVLEKIEQEKKLGLDKISTYENFQTKIEEKKKEVVEFLADLKSKNKVVVGYGAPAKACTFLNYCEMDKSILSFTVDKSTYKQKLYLPSTHIPIFKPEKIFETKPDYVLILAWNLKDEIIEQMKSIKDWGGKFVVFIPELEIIE